MVEELDAVKQLTGFINYNNPFYTEIYNNKTFKFICGNEESGKYICIFFHAGNYYWSLVLIDILVYKGYNGKEIKRRFLRKFLLLITDTLINFCLTYTSYFLIICIFNLIPNKHFNQFINKISDYPSIENIFDFAILIIDLFLIIIIIVIVFMLTIGLYFKLFEIIGLIIGIGLMYRIVGFNPTPFASMICVIISKLVLSRLVEYIFLEYT